LAHVSSARRNTGARSEIFGDEGGIDHLDREFLLEKIMPTSAILVTYRDMEPKVLPEFITKARDKYRDDRFKRLYFDDAGLKDSLLRAVDDIPADQKLKIFISGHGGTGIQYITADDQVRKQTVEDLTSLLKYALKQRATSRANSANTEVNMVSCLFGRTPVGGLGQCPAVRLHLELCRENVYVDLVACTESIVAKAIGRTTISRLNESINELMYGKRDIYCKQKTQFSKIRCTYQGGVPVVLIKNYYSGDVPYINSESPEGKRILWADNVVNEIVKYIKPSKGVFSRKIEITAARDEKLYNLLTAYDTPRDPQVLKQGMENLLPEFSIHRDRIHGSGLPKTAELITNLLRTYPG
jgi:hypothetical protein